MIKQLLNSVIAQCRDLSMSRRSIIDLLATNKSRYLAQPRPIIVNYPYVPYMYTHAIRQHLKDPTDIRKRV